MGMDLIGARLSYNSAGWRWLMEKLDEWGVDVSELSLTNDGHPISKETCAAIADAIELHLGELSEKHRDWLTPHIEAWRGCNGCEQW